MTHLAVLKGLSVPVPGELLLSVCSTREKNRSRAWDTLIPGLWEGAETTVSPQGHSRKSGGGDGTWKHREAQSLPEARSNLSSSRHIPLRFGFVSLRSSMISPSRAVPCVSRSTTAQVVWKVQVTEGGGETQGGAVLSGKAPNMSDIAQSDCNGEFIANWADVRTCNPSRTFWVRSEVTVFFMLLPGEGLSGERHAWNIYLDESFGCLLIRKNTGKKCTRGIYMKVTLDAICEPLPHRMSILLEKASIAADCGGAWPLSL